MIRIALIAVLLCGCKIKNELSCDNPDVANMPHCSNVDAPEACSDADPCTTGVCKLPQGVCVDCVENTDCTTATTPVCNASNECEACDAHADCVSEVCNFADGSCVAEAAVLYVAESGAGAMCTRADPCGTLTEAFALLTTTQNIVKLSGDVVDTAEADSDGEDFTLFAAPGATLSRSSGGSVILVKGGSNATIFDLEIAGSGAVVTTGLTIDGQNTTVTLERVVIRDHLGRGINVVNAPQRLTMRRCIVSANTGGGMDAQNLIVDMTNNLFVRNGNPGQGTGGITLRPNAGSTFEFNTVADNNSSQSPNGMICVVAFPIANNIVTGNEMGTSCQATFSLFDNETSPLPNGMGNRNGSAMFANMDPANPTGPTYYRISTGSDAIDLANPSSTQAIDIDGQTRPNGTVRDMGADELNP